MFLTVAGANVNWFEMKNRSIHPTQKRLLDLLAKNVDDPLTIREMQIRLKVSSTSIISHHLIQLEKKGFLKRNPSNSKDYQVLQGEPERQIVYLNLYGPAHCGPRGSILDDDPIDRIPISTRLLSFASSDAFLVKAKGGSMAPKINDGDIVIAKKAQHVGSGSVFVCMNDGEVLIKRVLKEKQGCILISSNPEFTPFLASKNFKIVGEVRGVISYNVS